ncbi:MAG: DUF3794 domain-containing protein [Clostridia bacterium]|nr:DUF3794 domain-containing protein [Clostridia bacterium]
MALEYNSNSISKAEKVFEGSCEQAIDWEVNLPDYCADILRILKCTVTPCVVSSKISGDRACADGNAIIRIVYCDEEDNICSVEQSMPFSKFVETGSDIEGALYVTAKPEYVNCRAVSRRKAEVHGTVRFAFRINKVMRKDFICSVESDGIQTKGGTVDYASVSACDCKQFPISETAELPRDYLPAQKFINCSAVAILNEAKIIKGKLLLKGEINAEIIYCTDKNKGECVKFDYSIPVNQVVDVAGVSDDGFADVSLAITSCDISPREDADGEQRLFDINLVACAKIKAYIKKDSEFISDAYSTTGELVADYENIEFYRHAQSVNDTFTCTNKFDFSSVSAQKMQAMWFGSPEIKVGEGNQEKLCGKVPVNFILTDADGKQIFCEREFDFEYRLRGDGYMLSEPSISLSGYTPTAINNGTADVKAEFVIYANTFSKEQKKVMASARIDEESGGKKNTTGVVIYFPDDNESLWDIARKYGTTEQAIKKENGITGDNVTVNEPIVVPCS